MWLWELHAGHTHPHLFPKIPPQITSSKAYQTTTCTRKSSANPVRIKNPSRKERHVAGDIRVKNQAHSRRVRYICVVWTSSKPDNGNQTKLNWITSIKGHRKLGKRSKIFFWLLCYSPKYRSEVPCKWNDTGNALRRFIPVRTRIKKQSSRSLLLFQTQQWKIQQWSSSETFKNNKACNEFRFRKRNCIVVLQLQSSHTPTNILEEMVHPQPKTPVITCSTSAQRLTSKTITQVCKIIWCEIKLIKIQRSSKSIWRHLENRNMKQGRLSLQRPSSETLHRKTRWLCYRHAIIKAVNIRDYCWEVSFG